MTIDDRLRSHLRARAAGIEPESAEVHVIAQRARRRRVAVAAAGGGVAAVLVAAVLGIGLLLRDGDSQPDLTLAVGGDEAGEEGQAREEALEENAEAEGAVEPGEAGTTPGEATTPACGTIDLQPVDSPPGIGTGRLTVGRDGEFLLLDQGLDNQPVLYVSPDGSSWSTLDLGIGSDLIVTAIAWSGERYYAAGIRFEDGPDAGGPPQASFVASSDDLTEWDVRGLPRPAPPEWEGTIFTGTSVEHVVTGPAGVLLIGSQWIDLDLQDLLDDPTLADGGWGVIEGANGEIAFELFAVDPEADDAIQTITAEELGIDPELAELLGRGGARTVAWVAADGEEFELVDTSGLDAAWVNGAVATESGFAVAGAVGSPPIEPGTAAVWTSPDGRSWTRASDTGFGDSDIVGGIAELDGRLTVVGTCEGRPVAWTRSDDGTWQMTDLSADLGLGAGESSWIWLAASSPAGLVALAEAHPPWQPPVDEVTVEANGYSMLIDNTSFRTTFFEPDGSVIAEIDGVEPPDPATLPDRVRLTSDTSVEILDESGSEVVAVFTEASISAAIEAAVAGVPPEESGLGGESPRRALLHSTDGSSWSVTDLDAIVDPDVLLVPTGLAVSESTVLLVGFDEGEIDPEGGNETSFRPERLVAYLAPIP